MKTVNISEFRKNIKKYTDLAERERVVIHRSKGKSFALVPLDEIDETTYLLATQANKESLERAIEQAKNREGRLIKIEELWK